MPRPFCAIFSPDFQSPRNLPSAGHLTPAYCSFCSLSATSLGGLSLYLLHAACTASSFSRSMPAMPTGWKSRCIRASASSRGLDCMAAQAASSAAPAAIVAARPSLMARLLALDAGALVLVALGVDGEIGEQRAQHLRGVVGLGEALLAEAVVQAPLQRVHHAAGQAVARPALHRADRLLGLGEVGQRLRADALAVHAVAAGAGKIVGARAVEEDLLANGVGLLLLRVRLRRRELHARRLRGDIRGDGYRV